MSESKRHIGKLLKQARLRMHLRAEDVAEACNVSRSRYYQWEAAKSVLKKNLKPLSQALNIPLTRLQRENRPEGRACPKQDTNLGSTPG